MFRRHLYTQKNGTLHHIFTSYIFSSISMRIPSLRAPEHNYVFHAKQFQPCRKFFFHGKFTVVMIWQASVQLLHTRQRARKSVLTADDKFHLPAARRWNHCRGDETWRLFCAFLHLFCGRMPRRRVGQVATCPRNELIVSRDAHMYGGLTIRPEHESALRRVTTRRSVIKSVVCLAY